jgi:hypothetical protein
MEQMTEVTMAETEIKKKMAGKYLAENEPMKALPIYMDLLRDNPNDVEVLLLLGDLFRASADEANAVRLYANALSLDPTNLEILNRLQVPPVSPQPPTPEPLPIPVPSDPGELAVQLQELSGLSQPVADRDINRAAELLESIINSVDPAGTVADRLSEIDGLLPALIELNVRQARADGRPDLAKGLQDLQTNIQLQVEMGAPAREIIKQAQKHSLDITAGPAPKFTGSVLLISPGVTEESPRGQVIAEALTGTGCRVTCAGDFPENFLDEFDLVIASHPHTRPELLEGLAACHAHKTPVILDLEADYEQIPVNHPDYESLGLGTLANSKAFMTALLLADGITVPSENLALNLRAIGYSATILPDGWSRKNPLWEKPPYPRHTFNLGWVGLPGQQEDVLQIRRVIIRVMREFPHTQLVVTSDPNVYQLFESLPEPRRLFLPAVEYEDYPYMLGQFDVLMLPLRNIPYNRALSDRLLVEAGAKGIPWAASPVPAYVTWQAGGLIAATLDEWHTILRQMILDADLCRTLGMAGKQHAEIREAVRLGQAWQELICGNEKISSRIWEGPHR